MSKQIGSSITVQSKGEDEDAPAQADSGAFQEELIKRNPELNKVFPLSTNFPRTCSGGIVALSWRNRLPIVKRFHICLWAHWAKRLNQEMNVPFEYTVKEHGAGANDTAFINERG